MRTILSQKDFKKILAGRLSAKGARPRKTYQIRIS